MNTLSLGFGGLMDVRDFSSLEEGGIQGAVVAQFVSYTRVYKALGVLPDPFLGVGVVGLACREYMVFTSRVNGKLVQVDLGYPSQ